MLRLIIIVMVFASLGACTMTGNPFQTNDQTQPLALEELLPLLEFSLPPAVLDIHAQYSVFSGQGRDLNLSVRFGIPVQSYPSFQESLQSLSSEKLGFRDGYNPLLGSAAKQYGLTWWTPERSVRYSGVVFTSNTGRNYRILTIWDSPFEPLVYIEIWW